MVRPKFAGINAISKERKIIKTDRDTQVIGYHICKLSLRLISFLLCTVSSVFISNMLKNMELFLAFLAQSGEAAGMRVVAANWPFVNRVASTYLRYFLATPGQPPACPGGGTVASVLSFEDN